LTAFERRQRMLDLLRTQPGMRVPELAEMLAVSQGTVRNDMEALALAGQLKRVHGGAALAESQPQTSASFAARARHHESLKLAIARRAAELVQDGDSIYLDASSTVYSMARFLADRRRLRVVTNGLDVARTLAAEPSNQVILPGGALSPDGSATAGSLAEQVMAGLHVRQAFVSASGVTLPAGLTDVYLDEARLKSKAIAAADRVVALVDSSKFGKVDLTAFASLEQVWRLFVDDGLSAGWIEQLRGVCQGFTLCAVDTVTSFYPCSETHKNGKDNAE
jgi:DeoR/GlpR family transcriptional regulator of sugar metabolism